MRGTTVAEIEPAGAEVVGIKVLTGEGQATDLRYDVARGSLFSIAFTRVRTDSATALRWPTRRR